MGKWIRVYGGWLVNLERARYVTCTLGGGRYEIEAAFDADDSVVVAAFDDRRDAERCMKGLVALLGATVDVRECQGASKSGAA